MSNLYAARKLYEQFGFHVITSKTHQIWGKELTEELWELELNTITDDWKVLKKECKWFFTDKLDIWHTGNGTVTDAGNTGREVVEAHVRFSAQSRDGSVQMLEIHIIIELDDKKR